MCIRDSLGETRIEDGRSDALVVKDREFLALEPADDPSVVPALLLENVDITYPKQGRRPAFRAAEGINCLLYTSRCV